jgi:hypothetical protein
MQSLVLSLSIALSLSTSFGVAQERSFRAAPIPVVVADTGTKNKTVRVWVDAGSGVYHCPGTRYFGATKRGKYLTEQDARNQGYRGAGGRGCGTGTGSSPERSPAPGERLGIAELRTSNPSTKVWVKVRRVSLSRHAVLRRDKVRAVHD